MFAERVDRLHPCSAFLLCSICARWQVREGVGVADVSAVLEEHLETMQRHFGDPPAKHAGASSPPHHLAEAACARSQAHVLIRTVVGLRPRQGVQAAEANPTHQHALQRALSCWRRRAAPGTAGRHASRQHKRHRGGDASARGPPGADAWSDNDHHPAADGSVSSRPPSPGFLLQRLQNETLGAELEQGLLGGALQRWPSFTTEGFGHTPCGSTTGNSSPAGALSPPRSPPRVSSPSRFIDPGARLAEHLVGGGRSRGGSPERPQRAAASAGGASHPQPAPQASASAPQQQQQHAGQSDDAAVAAREAAAAVRAVHSALRSGGGGGRAGGDATLAPGAVPALLGGPGAAGLAEEGGVQVPGWLASSTSVWRAPDSAPSGDQGAASSSSAAAAAAASEAGQGLFGTAPPGDGQLPGGFLDGRSSMLPPGGGGGGASDSEEDVGPPGEAAPGAAAAVAVMVGSPRGAGGEVRSPRGGAAGRQIGVGKKSDAVNRLTTTRADLGAAEEGVDEGPPPPASKLERLVLSRAQVRRRPACECQLGHCCVSGRRLRAC